MSAFFSSVAMFFRTWRSGDTGGAEGEVWH